MKNSGLICTSLFAVMFAMTLRSAITQPTYPKPKLGFRDILVSYDDQIPETPLDVAIHSNMLGSPAVHLGTLPKNGTTDGFQFTGTIQANRNLSRKAHAVCIAVDMTRGTKESIQLLTSRSDIFFLENSEVDFTLSICIPTCDDPMSLSLIAILLDDQGAAIGSEHVIARGEILP